MLRFADTSDAVSASEVSELLNDSARLPCVGHRAAQAQERLPAAIFETGDSSLASVGPRGNSLAYPRLRF